MAYYMIWHVASSNARQLKSLFCPKYKKNSFHLWLLASIASRKLHLVMPYPAEMFTVLKCPNKFLFILFLPCYHFCFSVIKHCPSMCRTDQLRIMQKSSLLFLILLSSCSRFLCHASKYSPPIFECCHGICVILSDVWNSLLPSSSPASGYMHSYEVEMLP